MFKDLPTTGRKNVEAGDPLDQHVEDEVQHIYNQLVEHLRTEGYDEEEPKNKKTGQIKYVALVVLLPLPLPMPSGVRGHADSQPAQQHLLLSGGKRPGV